MSILPEPGTPGESRPIVNSARQALRALNIQTSEDAVDALRMWARRDELTAEERDLVIAEFEHPGWCKNRLKDPRRCEDRGEHRSVRTAVNPGGDEQIGVQLYMAQFVEAVAPPTPIAWIVLIEDAEENPYPLTVAQLRTLGRAARQTLKLLDPVR